MKKFMILFLMLIGFAVSSNAQVQWYRTTAFAQANVYNGRYVWGNWEGSNMRICINLNTDVVTIFSPTTQVYRVVSSAERVPDNSGTTIQFRVVDQDGDRGHMRLRIENSGSSQLYIDFNNIAWVYSIVRTN